MKVVHLSTYRKVQKMATKEVCFIFDLTESYNYQMERGTGGTEFYLMHIGRNLIKSSMINGHLIGMEVYHFFWSPIPLMNASYNYEVSSDVHQYLSFYNLNPLFHVLYSGVMKNRSTSSSMQHPFRNLKRTIKSLLSPEDLFRRNHIKWKKSKKEQLGWIRRLKTKSYMDLLRTLT